MSRVVFALLAFIGAFFQIFVTKNPPLEAFLFNFIIFIIGFWGIFEFMRHWFESDIGWQPIGFSQKVIVFFNLLRGILGILCIWFRGDFWSITVVISSIFIFGYGCYEFRHIEERAINKNRPTYYTDFIVSFDLLFPFALITLLIMYKMGM